MFHGELFPRSATDEAWRLLSSYLERYPSQNSLYHRCVINKLLAHGIPLPNWLINSYKVRTGRQKPQNSILSQSCQITLTPMDTCQVLHARYQGSEQVPLSVVPVLVTFPG